MNWVAFVMGAVIGGAVMTMIVGALATVEIDALMFDAFQAGKARGRAELEGDDCTELGRVR